MDRFIDGIEPLLRALSSAGVSMHTLSNYPVWYERIEAKLGLRRFIGERFVSFETGLRKPDTGAYLAPCVALSLSPEDCIFVDDRVSNCDAAVGVGMDAIVFRDAVTLRAALEARGVL